MKKINKQLMFFLALFLFQIKSAFAYLPAALVLDPLYSNITSDINELADRSWPIVFLVTGLLIAIGLFKTFTRKAAG